MLQLQIRNLIQQAIILFCGQTSHPDSDTTYLAAFAHHLKHSLHLQHTNPDHHPDLRLQTQHHNLLLRHRMQNPAEVFLCKSRHGFAQTAYRLVPLVHIHKHHRAYPHSHHLLQNADH